MMQLYFTPFLVAFYTLNLTVFFIVEFSLIRTWFSFFLLETFRKIGRNKNIPSNENNKPPIVPAASGNQKASFDAPIINGIKPSTVEMTVNRIAVSYTH